MLEKVRTDLFALVFKLNMLFSGKFAIIVISLKNLTSFFKLLFLKSSFYTIADIIEARHTNTQLCYKIASYKQTQQD